MSTYTGMALINLSKLETRYGESSFFESVANPNLNKIGVQDLADFEYWDFGTIKRYCNSIKKIGEMHDSLFVKFLKDFDALTMSDIKKIQNLKKEMVKIGPLELSESKISFGDIEEFI